MVKNIRAILRKIRAGFQLQLSIKYAALNVYHKPFLLWSSALPQIWSFIECWSILNALFSTPNVLPCLLVLHNDIIFKLHCNYKNQASIPKKSLLWNKLKATIEGEKNNTNNKRHTNIWAPAIQSQAKMLINNFSEWSTYVYIL